MAVLTQPSIAYKESYIGALYEALAEGSQTEKAVNSRSEHFDAYLKYLTEQADPARLTPDKVPQTTLWLIDDGHYIGRASLRHWLNPRLLQWGGHIGYNIRPSQRRKGYGREILRLSLPYAQRLGITRALLTCDEANVGSRKIIEANGGQFENAIYIEDEPGRKLRYWIDLTSI